MDFRLTMPQGEGRLLYPYCKRGSQVQRGEKTAAGHMGRLSPPFLKHLQLDVVGHVGEASMVPPGPSLLSSGGRGAAVNTQANDEEILGSMTWDKNKTREYDRE